MPFKSKAQQRFMFAAEARGDIPKGTAKRWAKETRNLENLPERVIEKKSAYELGFELALRDYLEKQASIKRFFSWVMPKTTKPGTLEPLKPLKPLKPTTPKPTTPKPTTPKPTTPGNWQYVEGIGWVNTAVPKGGRVGVGMGFPQIPFATLRAGA